jgi:hypothetical protein
VEPDRRKFILQERFGSLLRVHTGRPFFLYLFLYRAWGIRR